MSGSRPDVFAKNKSATGTAVKGNVSEKNKKYAYANVPVHEEDERR